MRLLGAYVDGKLDQHRPYLFHRSTWMPEDSCFQDMFVADSWRGWGLGVR